MLSFFQRLHDHVFEELLAGEEGEHVFERLGDHGAVGLLVGLEAGCAHLVGDDVDVDEDGALHVEDAADVVAEVALVGDDDGGDALGVGEAAEAGDGDAGGGVAADAGAAEVSGLRGADGGVAVVVEDEEADGQAEAGGGFELLAVELESAVAVDEDGAAAGGADADGDGHGQAVAHGPEAGGVVDALAGAGGAGEEMNLVTGNQYIDGFANIWPDYEHRAEEEYRARSAIDWADQINVPVLILHSRTDRMVPSIQALRMAEALQDKGKVYALRIYERDGHPLPGHRDDRNRMIVDWFNGAGRKDN